MEVYAHPIVQGIREYYGSSLFEYQESTTISQRLTGLSELLWEAYCADNSCVLNEINNYHPSFIGMPWEEIKKNDFSKNDADTTIARQYGYTDLSEIPDTKIDVIFEQSIDLMLSGNLDELKKLIAQFPQLIQKESDYGHAANLLHYLGNNGVELYRQVVPLNLGDIMDFLLKMGADPKSTMNVYGGRFTMIELFSTSIHPKDAGINDEIMDSYNRLVS